MSRNNCIIVDSIDKKILVALLENGRIPYSQLAKRVRISRERARYRVQQLQKRGIIRDFVAEINYEALGLSKYVVYVQYATKTLQQETKLLHELEINTSVSWIGMLAGRWNLTFDIHAKSFSEADELVRTFVQKHEQWILAHRVLPTKESEFFFEKVFDAQHQFTKKKTELQTIDETDKYILNQLVRDARVQSTVLASALGITGNSVGYRLRELQKNVIAKYTVSIDFLKLEYLWYGLQLQSNDEMHAWLRTHPHVTFSYTYLKTGAQDIDIGILVKSPTELRTFINELRSAFPKTTILDVFNVLEEKTPHAIFKI